MHVVDASDPAFRDQLQVTREVLGEIHADQAESLLVLNKIDRVDGPTREALALEYPDAMAVSARSTEDLARVRDRIIAHFERDMGEAELFVPYAKGALVHRIHESARVLEERHDDEGTHLRVRAPGPVIAKLRAQI